MTRIISKIFILTTVFAGSLSAQDIDFAEDRFVSIGGDSLAEDWVVKLANVERKKAGLSELAWDTHLRSAARQHSDDMLTQNYFSHNAPSEGLRTVAERVYQTGLSDASLGENIALHSLDADAKAIATQLMVQWMNSPGHRANILKPEFTHIGVGVASSKDSVVKDTLIRGSRTRLVRYAIRHYGTQVFSERALTFSELKLTMREEDFLVLDLSWKSDRSMLIAVDNFTQFIYPAGGSVNAHVEIPYRYGMPIVIARADNEQTKAYVQIFQDSVTNLIVLNNTLSALPMVILRKEVRVVRKEKYFLAGQALLADPSLRKQCHLYYNQNAYFVMPRRGPWIDILVPMESGTPGKWSFAVGQELSKAVTNQLWIETDEAASGSIQTRAARVFRRTVTP